jgi:hypothetical protein
MFIRLVLIPCLAQALQPTPVSGQRRQSVRVPHQIVEDILKDTLLDELLPNRAGSLAANLVAVPVDLNGDAVPELEIRALNFICGPNNCPTWIYRRTASGYERLLDANSVQTLQPKSTLSHGYRDIMTARHGSAWDSDLVVYKFDGRVYRQSACFSRTYRYRDAHGNFHELKRPRIAPVSCGTRGAAR